jgi:hypothetical protein
MEIIEDIGSAFLRNVRQIYLNTRHIPEENTHHTKFVLGNGRDCNADRNKGTSLAALWRLSL